MPLLTIVPPMPGAERRFRPFVDFIQKDCGLETEFVRLDWPAHQPPFGSTTLFPKGQDKGGGALFIDSRLLDPASEQVALLQ